MLESPTYLELFSKPADEAWAFAGQKSTHYLTHGYHRYPAKFVPNLVKKLIEQYTTTSDLVVDIFAGCGTTLVESKVHGRRSIGVDINPVARIITRAKITPIEPDLLSVRREAFLERLKQYDASQKYYRKMHARIDYWFRENEKNKIAFLHKKIRLVRDESLRDFYLCALSNILKPCSRWLQSGTKPQIDPLRDENIADPFSRFEQQTKHMERQNRKFHEELKNSRFMGTSCQIRKGDARATGIRKESVGAVITSPPYVTSYEYADIHQLTGYWFDFIDELPEFRKQFIGTFYSGKKEPKIATPIAKHIVDSLRPKSGKFSRELANYFNDMARVAKEMHRILKPGGVACMVVGNTNLLNVEITSAQAFAELLTSNGFEITDVIKRQVTNKLNPTIRDKESGRFTTLSSENRKEVYPEEYILVATKPRAEKTRHIKSQP